MWTGAVRGPLDVGIAAVGFTLLVAWRASAFVVVLWCVIASLALADFSDVSRLSLVL